MKSKTKISPYAFIFTYVTSRVNNKRKKIQYTCLKVNADVFLQNLLTAFLRNKDSD